MPTAPASGPLGNTTWTSSAVTFTDNGTISVCGHTRPQANPLSRRSTVRLPGSVSLNSVDASRRYPKIPTSQRIKYRYHPRHHVRLHENGFAHRHTFTCIKPNCLPSACRGGDIVFLFPFTISMSCLAAPEENAYRQTLPSTSINFRSTGVHPIFPHGQLERLVDVFFTTTSSPNSLTQSCSTR